MEFFRDVGTRSGLTFLSEARSLGLKTGGGIIC